VKLLGLLVALFIALIGLTGIFAPNRLMTISQSSVTPVGIYVAAALRIGIGLVLVRVAPSSRAPKVLFAFGVIAVIAGLVTLFLGIERAQVLLEWWSAQGPGFIRLWAGLPLVLGGFIAYAILRQGESDPPRG
jgi:hypothetical protein